MTTAATLPSLTTLWRAALLVLGLLGGWRPVSAEELVWHYTVRPDDQPAQLASAMLDPRYRWGDLASYNQLQDPLRLAPGTVLKIPFDWLRQQPEPAMTAAVTGDAIFKPQRAPAYRPLVAGQSLNVGDEVRTLKGYVTIQMADDAVIRLMPNTRVVFNRLTQFGKTGMVDTRLRLERGQVNTQVTPFHDNGSRFEIETPSALAAVRGTQFRLKVTPDATWVEVTEGVVAMINQSASLAVPAGRGARVEARGQPELLPLPPAPRALVADGEVEALPHLLQWGPVPASSGYHLTVIDGNTGEVLGDHQLEKPTWELNYVDNGIYEIELAAVDQRGHEGASTRQEFVVGMKAFPARLLAPSSNAVLTESLPEFRWERVGGDQLFRLEIAREASFDTPVIQTEWAPETSALPTEELSPGHYFWRVRSQAGGSSAELSPVQRFSVAGTLEAPRIISVNYVHDRVRVFWTTLPAAQQYRLQVAEDPAFTTIIKEQVVTETTASLQLTPGTHYYVRIQGVGDPMFTASFSEGKELFVR